jgi:isopentenyldiphosphate isomerase
MNTTRETVKVLCKKIISRLENDKAITFHPRLRQVVQEELYNLIGPSIMTEEDLRERSLAKLGIKASELQDTQFTETDQYRAAKAVIRKSFGDDVLNGFYFQKNLKSISEMITEYLMRSSHIDDVFETDEVLQKQIVEIVQKFGPNDMH